ncbi:MAG: hypothetical protein ACLFMX_06630 [Halobacteriales archaeon]
MEFEFECDCGARVSDFTRGESVESNLVIECPACDAVYALTLTKLQSGTD